jgi:hypothetical protein
MSRAVGPPLSADRRVFAAAINEALLSRNRATTTNLIPPGDLSRVVDAFGNCADNSRKIENLGIKIGWPKLELELRQKIAQRAAKGETPVCNCESAKD